MPHRVENPVERNAQLLLAALPRPLEPGKDRLKARGIVIAPHVNDADRDVDLGVHHALRGQLLHHAPGDEFVVVGIVELPRDGLECLNEPGEISELVECFGFGQRDRLRVVACAQLTSVAGGIVPSRCRWSSALGSRRIKSRMSLSIKIQRAGANSERWRL